MAALATWLFLCVVTWTGTVSAADSTAQSKTAAEPPEIGLEELLKMEIATVEGASKYKQKVTEAPATVSIITSAEVKKYGYRTLADILRSVNGLFVTHDRSYSFLGVRGFNRPGDYNSRILVLVNGHRLNENIADGGYIGTEFLLDVDLIDRVEVIRGPGSIVYGNNAFFGVVNVITRKGADVNNVEASGEYGEFNAAKGRVTVGHSFTNGVEMLISGSYYHSDGPARLFYPDFNNPANNNGLTERTDFDHYKSMFGSISYRGLTLEGGFIQREKGTPVVPPGFPGVGPPLRFNDPRNFTLDERGYSELRFEHELPSEVTLTAKLYYDSYAFSQDSVASAAPFPVSQYFNRGEWWGSELQARKRLFDRWSLTLGAEYRDDFHQEDSITRRSTSNHGVYLENEFPILTNLVLHAGGRYDQYGSQDPGFNPRLALIYNPFEATVVKAIYGTAFRAPNFYELTAPDPSVSKIDPEKITTYELALEQGFGAHFRASSSIYYNQIDDLIGLGGNGFRNLSHADSTGLELGLHAQAANGLMGRLGYAVQRTENRDTHQRLSNSPEHLVKANVNAPLIKEKLFIGLEVQYTSSRLTVQGNSAPDYWVANLTLFSQSIVKGLDLSASVYNLFDKRFGDPGNSASFTQPDFLPSDGRSFRVKMTYRF